MRKNRKDEGAKKMRKMKGREKKPRKVLKLRRERQCELLQGRETVLGSQDSYLFLLPKSVNQGSKKIRKII